MTTLLCSDLKSTLEREVSFTEVGRIHIAGLYPYLLKVGNPSGTFTISFIKNSITLFSKSFISSEISTSSYAHCFYPILPDNPIQIEAGIYTVELSSSGYVYDSSNCISWVQQHENIQNKITYVPSSDEENPLTIRIKTYIAGIV